ncbi:hypothetical protein AVE81_005197 [Salmonella enterica subsp. diarizonae]|nr:hypothetical protein [Salmonella enterica subsp. diarizonae]ECF6072365.1 hypothetical protein [Salmonella enterica subsp. diarizonae]EDW9104181.1 hypothetical protein [Salmonella enterica subsp. diarizonae]
MRKSIMLVLGFSVILAGCDKAVEDKPMSELTSEEADSVCKRPEVISQLENSFKKGSIEFLSRNPLRYSPFIDRYKSEGGYSDNNERKKLRIDVSYNYTVDDFSKGFGTTDKVQINSATLTGTGKDDLSCSAKIEFNSDEIYGTSFSNDFTYNVKKENNKFITDAELSFEKLEHHKSEPTASQKVWRDKYEAKLNADEDALRNIPDADFKVISQDDIYYIYFAQTPRQFSDDELMGFFSRKWSNTTDVFAKEDIKKEELPKIKQKIEQYKDLKNILSYSTFRLDSQLDEKYALKTADGQDSIKSTSGWVSAQDSYDITKKGFKYNAGFCDMTGGLTREIRGIRFDIDNSLRGCTVEVPDDKARELSAKLAAINSKGRDVGTFVKSYLHISKVDGDDNTIHATIIREEVKVYDPESNEVIIDTVVR